MASMPVYMSDSPTVLSRSHPARRIPSLSKFVLLGLLIVSVLAILVSVPNLMAQDLEVTNSSEIVTDTPAQPTVAATAWANEPVPSTEDPDTGEQTDPTAANILNTLSNALVPYIAFAAPFAAFVVQFIKNIAVTIFKRDDQNPLPQGFFGALSLGVNVVLAIVGVIATSYGKLEDVSAFLTQLSEFLPTAISLFMGGSLGSTALYSAFRALKVPFLGTVSTPQASMLVVNTGTNSVAMKENLPAYQTPGGSSGSTPGGSLAGVTTRERLDAHIAAANRPASSTSSSSSISNVVETPPSIRKVNVAPEDDEIGDGSFRGPHKDEY